MDSARGQDYLCFILKKNPKQNTLFLDGFLSLGASSALTSPSAKPQQKNTRLRAGQLSVQVFVAAVRFRLARPHAGPPEIFQTLIPEHPVKSRKQVGGGMRTGGIRRRQQDGGRTRGRRKGDI